MWFYYYFRIWIFFHLLSKKVLYNYSYRYWCLILLKYRYVLITMLFSIEFNKVFVFLHNCLTFSPMFRVIKFLQWYMVSQNPTIIFIWRCLRHLPQTHNNSVWWSILHVNINFVHVVCINKMCSIGYNHDINDKKTFLNMTVMFMFIVIILIMIN